MAERQASELLERLRKVLELERAKGFKDAAVYGGLDRFLERWATQAGNSEDSAAQELSRELGASGIRYRELDAAARARWVERALASLSGASAPSALRQAQGERETSVPVKSSRSLRSGSPPSVRGELVEPQIDSAPLSEPLAAMKGFGPQLAARFERLGVRTVQDVLYLFPRRHQDFSRLATVVELRPGQEQTIDARVWGCKEKRLSTGRRIVEATLYDDTGNVQVTWYNLGFLARELKPNTRVIISGRVGALRGRPHFEHPEYEIVDEETQELIHTGRLVPVYPATEGLRQRTLRRWVKRIVDQWSPAVRDFLPSRIRSKAGFLELAEAVRQAHYPDDLSKQDDARRRLAFDELFLMQLGILQRRKEWRQGQPGRAITVDQEALDAFLSSLPFTLTGSQQRVLDQVLRDIQRSIPMARLLQGEVGSGKTVVAT
ncbi:MAG: DNA helicase RecG, partial [Chloroflexi bacterium]|nr:DNA helicase RecG [Chloroflexota bacterium]